MAQNSKFDNILDYETFGDNQRSYYFDIKQARNNKHYLRITRRDATKEKKTYKRTQVIFFEDEIPFLVEALSMVLTRYSHSQMPHQVH